MSYNELKGETALSSICRFDEFKAKAKNQLVKSLVLPHLTYPAIPLHTAKDTNMLTLQKVQNASLRFIYKKKKIDRIRAEHYHNGKYKMLPINQTLYWRAKNIWKSIRDNNAADYDMSDQITKMPIVKEHTNFPSSLKRVHDYSNEPDPLYTKKRKRY